MEREIAGDVYKDVLAKQEGLSLNNSSKEKTYFSLGGAIDSKLAFLKSIYSTDASYLHNSLSPGLGNSGVFRTDLTPSRNG